MNGSDQPPKPETQNENQHPNAQEHVFLKPSLPYWHIKGKGSKLPKPKSYSESPDFIPLSLNTSNDINIQQGRQEPNWKNYNNNASTSSSSSSVAWKNPNMSRYNSFTSNKRKRGNTSFNFRPHKKNRTWSNSSEVST